MGDMCTKFEVDLPKKKYLQTSNISCALAVHKIIDLSEVIGASPAGAAPSTSSFWT